ncbi:MAG: NUDIX domain-containing protein [Acidimicrobiia bacterium]|nr:NUDIX domain-containing protein [Acidimicrobiia bacterium]
MAVPAGDQPIRPASSVLALRPAAEGYEVLMVRRVRSAVFMGDAHVFPGGALEECDRSATAASVVRWSGDPEEFPWRAAALRELAEEAGVFLTDPPGVRVSGQGAELYRALVEADAVLDADCLAYISNWVTPRGAPRRFDARFYAGVLPAGTPAGADRAEVTEACWVKPGEALQRAAAGEWRVELPTRKHLEALAACGSPEAVLAGAPGSGRVARVEPRLAFAADGSWRVLLPGEEGYEEAGP